MKVTPNDEWKGKTEPRPIKITGPNSARSYAKGLIYETLENSDIKRE